MCSRSAPYWRSWQSGFPGQKITAAELTELQGAMEQFVEMSRSDDIAEVASADVNFHDVLYKASDTRSFWVF